MATPAPASGSNGAASASSPATGDNNDDDWGRFEARVKGLIPAMVGLTSMFTARHLPCPLRTLSGTLASVGFDVVTLRLLHSVAPRLLSVAHDPRDPGASNVSLVLHDDDEEEDEEGGQGGGGGGSKGKAKKRKRPAPPKKGRGGSFKAQPPIENLEKKVATLKEAFLQDLARFCTDGLNQGRKPPPLNQAEEAAAAAAQSNEEEEEGKGQAAPPTTDPPPAWLPADPVTPANFLAYVQTLPFYRGQLRHTETILGRAPHTVPLAAVPILHPSIRAALEQDKGVADLYTHQARAIEAILPPSPASGQVGRDVIVTTATASGKSLCYTVPFLQSCLAAPESTKAIFIYPSKALAQDQLASLRRFAAAVCRQHGTNQAPPGIDTYDGDTPKPQREQVRDGAALLLTNPDMLHASVLPHARAPKWRVWLRALRYIVVDEAHAYRGALGCHVALVLRRLLRAVAAIHREEEGPASSVEARMPRLILCSATISNPREHFVNLTGRGRGRDEEQVVVIDEDGSPQAARVFGLWHPKPPPPAAAVEGKAEAATVIVVSSSSSSSRRRSSSSSGGGGGGGGEEGNAKALRRRSPYKDTARLLAELVQRGLKTLVFVKVRYIAEVVLQMARELLPEAERGKVASYRKVLFRSMHRAGYLAEKRREIEGGLSSGRLLGVVATNALELGVDVGELDVTLHVGFPSTVSSLMQQAGRAGRRRGATALSVVIALDGPLDAFLVEHPCEVFARAIEPAIADADNPYALSEHLLCLLYEVSKPSSAASSSKSGEGPVAAGVVREDELLASFGSDAGSMQTAIALLVSQGHVARVGSTLQLRDRAAMHRRPPASRVNIRSISSETYRLLLEEGDGGGGGKVLETVEADKAFYQLYEGSVYLHQGEGYLVTNLDVTQRTATLRRQDTTYYTQPQDHTRVSILGTHVFDSVHVPPFPFSTSAEEEEGPSPSPSPPRLELLLRCGPVRVSKSVYGYKVIDKKASRITDVVELSLPAMEFDTQALWTELPGEIKRRFRVFRGQPPRPDFDRFDRFGLHAVEHLLISLAPLVVPCDPGDLSCQHTRRDTDLHREKLLLFETCRGGMGLTRRLAPHLGRLLQMAHRAISECPCAEGCLRCIVIGSCYEPEIDKAAAKEILDCLMAGGQAAVSSGAVKVEEAEGDGDVVSESNNKKKKVKAEDG